MHAIEHQQGDELEDWVKPMVHRAHAWELAMIAYFDSANERRPSDLELDAIRDNLHPVGVHDEDAPKEPKPIDWLPLCDGNYKVKKSLRYPLGGVRKGMFGSVIVQVDTDKKGKFQNVEVLAAVPSEGFKKRATDAISTWSWKPDDEEAVGQSCQLEAKRMIIPVVFALD